MKTTAKTILSLMAAGFALTTINTRSLAQSTPSEKPLSPQIMKILCERSPLNSRCTQGSNPDSSTSAPATPSPSGETAPKEEMKGDSKGEMKEEMKGETTPSSPAPATGEPTGGSTSSPTSTPGTTPDPAATPVPTTGEPAGGGALPSTGTPGTTPDPTTPAPTTGEPAGGGALPSTGTPSTTPDPTTPAPVESPGTVKPYQSDGDKLSNPVGPSSALPSVPSKISAEPTTSKSSGSASELAVPATTKTPATKAPSSDASSKPSSTASETSPTDKAPATEPTSPGTAGGSSSEAPTSGGDVVAVVGSNAKLKTLSSALKAAGLDEALAGKGPFTIFAPTDEAFNALPPEALKDLLKPENKAKLAALLAYHVVSGKVESKTLKSGETATVQGQPLTVKVEGSKVMVNDANVTQADVEASNGVIHLIDKVILPSAG